MNPQQLFLRTDVTSLFLSTIFVSYSLYVLTWRSLMLPNGTMTSHTVPYNYQDRWTHYISAVKTTTANSSCYYTTRILCWLAYMLLKIHFFYQNIFGVRKFKQTALASKLLLWFYCVVFEHSAKTLLCTFGKLNIWILLLHPCHLSISVKDVTSFEIILKQTNSARFQNSAAKEKWPE